MPYSEEDRWIIKHCHETCNWGSRKMLVQTKIGHNVGFKKLLRNLTTQDLQREGQGVAGLRFARIAENVNEVEDQIFSQENEEKEWE